MVSRKDQLKSMFEPVAQVPAEAAPARAASGAVKAMGLSLTGLQREIDEARALKEVLGEGERIIEIAPDLIDPSPYADRLSDGAHNDEAFAGLVASIKAGGQQVPVLVRAHPERKGRYQSAYGHRRIKAAQELGIAIKAIVRELTDAALLLAQGKENSERRDLSFIEKALFAKGMVDAGVDRAAAMEALGVHKTEMTRFIQVAEAIPVHIARAIGPAPKAGRPRWMALGELLGKDAAKIKAEDETGSETFLAADSDRRFQMLFDRLSRKVKAKAVVRLVKAQGLTIAVTRAGEGARFDVADAGFARWLEDNLKGLAERYRSGAT